MDFELKKEKTVIPKCSYEASAEQSLDIELNLPDYCSDIKRILKCLVIPGINSVQVAGERVSAQGEIVIRLIYVNESEKIDCYEHSADLSRYIDVKNMPDNPSIQAEAKVEYVNCRAASQRRFIVGGNVSVSFKVMCPSETEVACGVSEPTVEVKKEKIKAIGMTAIGEKTFDMSETIALADDKMPIGRIIRNDANAKIESIKSVAGKILIKGELACDILYCADSDEMKTEHLRHTMPISQIVEIANIDDEGNCSVDLSVRAVQISAKSDSSGANRLLEFAAKVSAFVVSSKENEIEYITDCYCTKYEAKAEYQNVEFLRHIQTLEKRKSVTKTVDLSGQTVKEIIDISSQKNSCTLNGEGEKLIGKANALFNILFIDSDDKLQFAQRNVDFDFESELSEKCEKLRCDPVMSIEKVDSSRPGGDKIELKCDFSVSAQVYSAETRRVLKNIEIDESKCKPASDAALTVYYAQKGENIWEIAKRYNTKISAVKDENSLTADVTDSEMMLMIPCV